MIQCVDRHLYYRGSENYFVVCNCCKESCVPIIAYRIFKDEPYAFYPSRSVSAVDDEKCRGLRTRASTPAPSMSARWYRQTPRRRETGADDRASSQLPGMRALRGRLSGKGDSYDSPRAFRSEGGETMVGNSLINGRYPRRRPMEW